MTGQVFSWPDDAIATLRAKWTAGLSAGQIAGALSKEFGVSISRNAVIGKISRLGIGASASRIKATQTASKIARPAKTEQVAVVVAPSAKVTPAAVPIEVSETTIKAMYGFRALPHGDGFDLLSLPDDGCRFIIGRDPGGLERYCGDRCERGRAGRFKSFCEPCGRKVVDRKHSVRKPPTTAWNDRGGYHKPFSRKDAAYRAR